MKGRPESLLGAEELARRDKHEFEKWIVPKLDGHLVNDGKKGADGGIDGIIYFKPDDGKARKAIISVKGGKNVGVAMVRDLVGVMKREKAEAGIFVTAELPTKPMLQEAAETGIFKNVHGKSYSRLQILTLAEIMKHGKGPDLPAIVPNYKRAQRTRKSGDQGQLI